MTLQDVLILAAYSVWSREELGAEFRQPEASEVRAFREWLLKRLQDNPENYETDMLVEWRRQVTL